MTRDERENFEDLWGARGSPSRSLAPRRRLVCFIIKGAFFTRHKEAPPHLPPRRRQTGEGGAAAQMEGVTYQSGRRCVSKRVAGDAFRVGVGVCVLYGCVCVCWGSGDG